MAEKEKVEGFLEARRTDIQSRLSDYPKHKSYIIDFADLEEYDSEIAEELLRSPDDVLPVFDGVLSEMHIPTVAENPLFHVRINNIPKDPGYTLLVRDITSDFIGRMIGAEGVVNKISDVLPKVKVGHFVCLKCGEVNREPQEAHHKHSLTSPMRCHACQGREFKFVPEESDWIDIQRIEIQEPLEMLKGGDQARRIEIWLEDDMVDRVTAGDKITLTGTVRLSPPKSRGPVYQRFIDANYIESVEAEFEDIEITPDEEKKIKKLAKDPKIYDKITRSIAPSIYGYNEVKSAIALQLFGGRHGKILPDGTHVRSDIHLLLIGDPGVAKSRVLQYVDQIAPKSIYVSGKGTTGAGLTASAERDELNEGAWTLKAGALVLAGGGIACIDEFDKIDKDDRSAMHEAMEQQTISVAKAGIVAKFKANTSVLAASNPKFSRFDAYKPIAEQFDIPPTLLSRFDLIFPIRDERDATRDQRVAEHILKMHRSEKELAEIAPEIEADIFRKYIAYARRTCFPVLTKEASDKIRDYYTELRGRSKDSVAATPRQLEALVRLSEASAKTRLSDVVTLNDVQAAVDLTEFVLREIAYDAATGTFDIDKVITSHPKAKRDRIHLIEGIIKELISSRGEDGASLQEVIEKAKEHNIDRMDAEGIIQELKQNGTIYEPRHGKFFFAQE
ncbi:Minichromosome maintenance protein MCM [uncultured archaeon]|nr:Minichromosome maintenance protein MCM [uncultured archaeon]